MRASRFEFEYRFWVFGLIFFTGFYVFYRLDPVNMGVFLLHWAWPGAPQNSAAGRAVLRGIFLAGAALAFAGAMLRTWGTAYLKADVVHDMSLHSERVVADGPYRYVRNPLYLGNLPLAAGMGLMASPAGWGFIVAAMWIFGMRLILREEGELKATQGEGYLRYMAAVPRLMPALRPRVPASGARPAWGQALVGEAFVWMFGVAMLVFAVTLTMKITGIVLGSSFVVYFVTVTLVKRQAAKKQGTSAEV